MKEWTCICGSKLFSLVKQEATIVDYSAEGAIEGHPHISRGSVGMPVFVCVRCHTQVPDMVAEEMIKEVI